MKKSDSVGAVSYATSRATGLLSCAATSRPTGLLSRATIYKIASFSNKLLESPHFQKLLTTAVSNISTLINTLM